MKSINLEKVGTDRSVIPSSELNALKISEVTPMVKQQAGIPVRELGLLCQAGPHAGLEDHELLERFLNRSGEAAEAAFEAIVQRHGALVLSICRAISRHDTDAEDSFQATFVVLARRAKTIRDRNRLAPWLGRVARRISRRARKESSRRASREHHPAQFDPDAFQGNDSIDPNLTERASLIRAQVDALPEADRLPLLMTYWQGKSYEETATLLGWPIGTVRSRLARARDRLRGRLVRLGLAPAVTVSGSLSFTDSVKAAPLSVSSVLISQTIRVAIRCTPSLTAAIKGGAVPAMVAALAQGELGMMMTTPWKWTSVLMIIGSAAGFGLTARSSDPPEPPKNAVEPLMSNAVQETESDPSLLTNRSFEEGYNRPEGWSQGASIDGVLYLWDREVAHSGESSLAIRKSAQRYFPIAQWRQEIDHQSESTRLKVSSWVKADQLSKAILDVQFIDANGERSHAWVAYLGGEPGIVVSHNWKLYEGVVEIPPGTQKIIVAPQLYGPGTVWFDDLNASYTDKAVTAATGDRLAQQVESLSEPELPRSVARVDSDLNKPSEGVSAEEPLEELRRLLINYGIDEVLEEDPPAPLDPDAFKMFPTGGWPSLWGDLALVKDPSKFRVIGGDQFAWDNVGGGGILLKDPLTRRLKSDRYHTLIFDKGIASEGLIRTDSYAVLYSRGDVDGEINSHSYVAIAIDGDLNGRLTADAYPQILVTGIVHGDLVAKSGKIIRLEGGIAPSARLLIEGKAYLGGKTTREMIEAIKGRATLYLESSDLDPGEHEIRRHRVIVMDGVE